MTDAQYLAWLADPNAIRNVLVEAVASVGGVETTFYMSVKGYTTSPTDTPANTNYKSIISTGVRFTEQLSLTAEAGLSAGDIEINNADGRFDAWLNYVWVNRSIKAWIGDVRWPRADYRMIFNGVVADIDSKSRDKLNLKLRDKLQRLNTPVTETKLGGTTDNKDEIIPVALGEIHNVTPLLVDPALVEYQVHGGAVEDIFEVRDNGLPVGITKFNSAGKFRLTQSPTPSGAITVTVQGDKPSTYSNTIAGAIQRLVTGYGKVSDRFTGADLDTANLAAFAAANPQPIGQYVSDRTNVLVACQELASSVGAQIVMSRFGLLRLIQIKLPATGTMIDIKPQNMRQFSLRIVARPPVKASVKVGFCKNWTVQEGLQTSLSARDKDSFATEWLTETVTDSSVQSKYLLNADPEQRDTLLLRRTDATAEATRELNLFKVQRTVYEFDGDATCLQLELGSRVRIFNTRFGLAGGVEGMVISLSPDWQNGRSMVQVLV